MQGRIKSTAIGLLGLYTALTLNGCSDDYNKPTSDKLEDNQILEEPIHVNSNLQIGKFLSDEGLSNFSRREYKGAEHLCNWALEYLDNQDPTHLPVIRDTYKTLMWIYEDLSDLEGISQIKEKMDTLKRYRNQMRGEPPAAD